MVISVKRMWKSNMVPPENKLEENITEQDHPGRIFVSNQHMIEGKLLYKTQEFLPALS